MIEFTSHCQVIKTWHCDKNVLLCWQQNGLTCTPSNFKLETKLEFKNKAGVVALPKDCRKSEQINFQYKSQAVNHVEKWGGGNCLIKMPVTNFTKFHAGQGPVWRVNGPSKLELDVALTLDRNRLTTNDILGVPPYGCEKLIEKKCTRRNEWELTEISLKQTSQRMRNGRQVKSNGSKSPAERLLKPRTQRTTQRQLPQKAFQTIYYWRSRNPLTSHLSRSPLLPCRGCRHPC